jgi:hypothetical protein
LRKDRVPARNTCHAIHVIASCVFRHAPSLHSHELPGHKAWDGLARTHMANRFSAFHNSCAARGHTHALACVLCPGARELARRWWRWRRCFVERPRRLIVLALCQRHRDGSGRSSAGFRGQARPAGRNGLRVKPALPLRGDRGKAATSLGKPRLPWRAQKCREGVRMVASLVCAATRMGLVVNLCGAPLQGRAPAVTQCYACTPAQAESAQPPPQPPPRLTMQPESHGTRIRPPNQPRDHATPFRIASGAGASAHDSEPREEAEGLAWLCSR